MIDITEGINLFNDGEFFAAHDYFEEIWIHESGESRIFYQGLIQISVGCFHLVSGNYRGAESQFIKGTTKLSEFLPCYSGVDIQKIVDQIKIFMEILAKRNNNLPPEIDFSLLPKIEFKLH